MKEDLKKLSKKDVIDIAIGIASAWAIVIVGVFLMKVFY